MTTHANVSRPQTGLVPESWHLHADRAAFRNPYEETKHAAEQLVRERLEAGTDIAVVRLAHIVGDGRTGRTVSDYGIYDFLRTLRLFGDRHAGRTVRIRGNPSARLDLVPIDVCCDWLVALEDAQRPPAIVHLAAGNALTAGEIAEIVSRHVGIRVVVVGDGSLNETPLDGLERVMRARLAFEGQYLGQEFHFDRTRLESVVGPSIALTDAELDRLVEWYIHNQHLVHGDRSQEEVPCSQGT